MSKFKLRRSISGIKRIFLEIKKQNIDCSQKLVERISSSGDTTGTPFYHWRWKKHNLADLIVYPTLEQDIQALLELGNKYDVSITPRGSGSCYYGSGCPANGGIVIDMKRMHHIQINKDDMTVIAQAGIRFSQLIDELDAEDLMIGCHPSSDTATIGGWAGTGGFMGIGTVQNGTFEDQVVAMKVILPNGNIKTHSSKKDISQYFGTNGVFGIITQMTLRVYNKPKALIPIMFGFTSKKGFYDSITELVKLTDPYLIRFSDNYHEYNCSGFTSYQHYLFVVYNGQNKDIKEDADQCFKSVLQNKGQYLGKNYSQDTWDTYLEHELTIKLGTPVQMLQQYNVELDECEKIITYFYKLIKERKLNCSYYGIINRDMRVRLCLYTPTDNKYWGHFLSSKGVLNSVTKFVYKNGGRIYTYGLINTIYLRKFEKVKYKKFQKRKMDVDPKNILNPLKLTDTKMKGFFRINLMFKLAMFWRRRAVKMGRAKETLKIEF